MKPFARLEILLPFENTKQENAAALVLKCIKADFRAGTLFATESQRPIARGWWVEESTNQKVDEDRHLLVSVDVPAESFNDAVERIWTTFRDCYRGRSVAQKKIYLARQEVLVRELPGRAKPNAKTV